MSESDRLRFEPIVSSERFDELRASRGAVYGDPKENHSLIAGQWAAILQPWGKHIAEGKPLPPHVVALCMVGLKLNRMRLAFHRDNYEDLGVYASMAMKWQQEWDEAQSQEDDRKFTAAWDNLRRETEKSLDGMLSRVRQDVNAPSGMVLGIVKNAYDKFKVPSMEDHVDIDSIEEDDPSPSVYNWHRYAAQRGMTE